MAGMEDQFARFSKLYDALSFLLGGVVSREPRAYSLAAEQIIAAA